MLIADELLKRGGKADRVAASVLHRQVDLGRKETTLTEAFFNGVLEQMLHPLRCTGLPEPCLVVTHLRSDDIPVVTALKQTHVCQEKQEPGISHLWAVCCLV